MHHDEHADERNELIQQLQHTVDSLADITPNISRISVINDFTGIYQGGTLHRRGQDHTAGEGGRE
jgi:hypothetical protein